MTTPYSIRDELKQARETMQEKYERVVTLRARAESIGAVRYDKDHVQNTNRKDITDTIVAIIDAENAFEASKNDFEYLRYVFRVYLITAGFDKDATRIWQCIHENGWSIGRTARALGTTRSHVQYVLTKTEPAFLAVPQ